MCYFIVNKADYEAWQPTGDPYNALTVDVTPDETHVCIYLSDRENPLCEEIETEFSVTAMNLEGLHQFQADNPAIFQE